MPEIMEIFFAPKEALFLTFKLTNGSGWLEGHTPDVFFLKGLEKAQIKDSTLIIHFRGRQVMIVLSKKLCTQKS
jgi:hypothetical protein